MHGPASRFAPTQAREENTHSRNQNTAERNQQGIEVSHENESRCRGAPA